MKEITMSNPYVDQYLNQEMREELFISLARKEANRIIHERKFRIASQRIEKHLKEKLLASS
ncbi:MAG: hypothetical protein ACW98K_01530 [Candidatus Kariarchaeaceae archaeon]|jgi:hypothetical protein